LPGNSDESPGLQRDRASGQVSLFDEMPAPASKPTSQRAIPWTEHETAAPETPEQIEAKVRDFALRQEKMRRR